MLQQRQRLSVAQHEAEKSNMNMTSIHCKLQEEAEKIRKWQTTSEIELKQKIAKLKECERLITNQRNQVLEKQIENENLVTLLQKEQMNQAQINVKLKTARELFIALKNHSENLQTSIVRGEEDRDSLRMLAADNIKQIQEMKTKMLEVVEATEKRVDALKACVKEKEITLEELAFSSKNEIESTKNTNMALEKEVASCKLDIDDISRQLLDKRSVISSLEDKIKNLESDKTKQLAFIASQDSKLDELQNMINVTKSAYKCAQENVEKLQQESKNISDQFNSYKDDAEQQIEELQTELTELTDSLTQLSTQYNEMASKNDRIESENRSLKDSVSQLVKCVEDLQEKQECSEAEVKNLTDTCSTAMKNELELKALVEDKEAKMQELSRTREEIETQLNSISESLNSVQLKEVEYLQEIEGLTLSNRTKDNKLVELENKSSDHDNHSKTIASDLDKMVLEYRELKSKCEQLEQDYQSMALSLSGKDCELGELVSKNESLKQLVNELLLSMQHLKDEHDNLTRTVSVMQETFDCCSSEMKSLRGSVRHQDNILAKKDAAALKLKDQIQSSAQKITDLLKSAMKLEQNLSDISSRKDKAEKLVEEKMKICCDLEQKNFQLQARVDQLLIEVDKSKSSINSAVIDSSDRQQKLYDQLSEATASLREKDMLIKNLNGDLAKVKIDLSKELKNVAFQKEACEKENVQLKSSISNKAGDISALAEEISKLQNKILKLDDAKITSTSATTDELKSLNLKIGLLEQAKKELLEKLSLHQAEQKLSDSEKLKFEGFLTEKQNEVADLHLKMEQLESDNSKYRFQYEDLKTEMGVLKDKQKNFKVTSQKLKEKEGQLKIANANLEQYSTAEKGYQSTIDKLKKEIKKLNKSKVEAVLSNVSSKSPAVGDISSFTSPIKRPKIANPDSPKTPTVSRSKKRRVAFGKSPSWHEPSDEEEADMTVSSSTNSKPNKVKYLSMSKSPKTTTYASAKSPCRLKLSKSPGPVTDLLAKYPTPSSAQKRGVKLPDAYLKRKEANEKKKQKIKVEASSWFDSDSAFGFDEM
ncbi:synaptonemal complex protein 1-like [Bolinopsis microptera]|uniref:synaptonemal complex protein 1-like n=1 Tax=Bolinopsis microptera TaxID=2820187 RepID=UPI003078EC5A